MVGELRIRERWRSFFYEGAGIGLARGRCGSVGRVPLGVGGVCVVGEFGLWFRSRAVWCGWVVAWFSGGVVRLVARRGARSGVLRSALGVRSWVYMREAEIKSVLCVR